MTFKMRPKMFDHVTVRQYSKLKFYIHSCFVCCSIVYCAMIKVYYIVYIIFQLGARHYAEECYIHSCFVCCSTVLWSRYIPVRCEALCCLLRCCAMSRYMYMYVFVPFRSKALCWGLLSVVHELKCFNVKILFELSSLFRVPWDDALGKIVSSGEGFELDTFKLYNYWFWGHSVNTLSMILFTFSTCYFGINWKSAKPSCIFFRCHLGSC